MKRFSKLKDRHGNVADSPFLPSVTG